MVCKAAAALLFIALAFSAAAFNITEILEESADFSAFNSLLSQMKLADEINRRETITVLVLDDSAVSAITSLPADNQRKVLAVHVILDYYDPVKLDGLKNRSALLTTLFQTIGVPTNYRMGFVNYTERSDNQIVFGSAEPGAPVDSELVRVVASRPYNVSVMQISTAIVPPSIGSKEMADAPSPATALSTRVKVPADGKAPEMSAPVPSNVAGAPAANMLASVADGPAAADEPALSSAMKSRGAAGAVVAAAAAGSKLVVRASVGFLGLLMSMIWP